MRILNFGSLNVDYVYKVDHLVMPGETIGSQKRELYCGGKGLNQSIALARAGAKVYHAGMMGDDGYMLTYTLQKDNVDTTHIKMADIGTGQALIQVDKHGQNSIILYAGANHMIDEPFVDEVLSHFRQGDYILLQNEISCLRYVMERAHEKKMKIVFNPAPFTDNLFDYPISYVDYLIVNDVEGKQLSGQTEPFKIAQTLLDQYSTAVLLTLGKQGSIYVDPSHVESHGIYEAPVVDTTGAGDTFTGYFLHAIITGKSPEYGLEIASKACAITVTREGSSHSIPYMREVIERFKMM